MAARILPLSSGLSPRRRALVTAVAAVTLAALGANLAFTTLGVGSEALLNRVGQNLIMAGAVVLCVLRARAKERDRLAWRALAVGLACWTLGNTHWNLVLYDDPAPPYPSLADAGWLLFYPAAYVCLGLVLRASVRSFRPSMWLDGLVGALAVAALGTALVLATVLEGSVGSRAAVLTNAAYPIGDILLASLAIAALGLHSWRPDRMWLLLCLGFSTFAAADVIYLNRLAADTYVPGTVLDSLWQVGAVLMAIAAWQPPGRARARATFDGWRMMAAPFLFGLAAIGVLLRPPDGGLGEAAAGFAAAALVLSMLRTALTVKELRTLSESRRQAVTDELTGLSNRRWFDNRLRAGIAGAERAGGQLAVLVIDLDRFKELNDTLGHHAGDRVLIQLGPRLRSALPGEDCLARLGGDEFAAVLPDRAAAVHAGERIAAVLEQPFSIDGIDLQIAASIGVAVYPEHGADAETLLQRADVAMYQAKSRRTGTEFYARERDSNTRERLQMIGELRTAVAERGLVLHYQPTLDLRTGATPWVEALVRWPHAERGLIPPGEFIPLAEQTGVIRGLTRFVLDEALRQVAEWHTRGIDVAVAVNVSATNLLDDGWAGEVLATIARHGLEPRSLHIEITEGVLMLDPERSRKVVGELGSAGVRVLVDDFGTGYSSLASLKQLPVHGLKADRTFVTHMRQDPGDAAIVQTLVDLARRLGLDLVAEGVEDAATLRLLADYGADYAQGFHIARPLPPAELEAWLGARALADDDDDERARPVDPLHAVELDVRRR